MDGDGVGSPGGRRDRGGHDEYARAFSPQGVAAEALRVLLSASANWSGPRGNVDADGMLQVALIERRGAGPAVAALAQLGGLLLAELAEERRVDPVRLADFYSRHLLGSPITPP